MLNVFLTLALDQAANPHLDEATVLARNDLSTMLEQHGVDPAKFRR